MTDDIAIKLNRVGKTYRIYNRPEDRLKQMLMRGFRTYFREFKALQGVDLTVHKGETVGLIGRNGSGKSTLLQIVCGTLAPTEGEMEVNGRISALLELGAGFNPEFSGRENIYLNASILGLSRQETDERYEDIVAFSGLDELHLQQPVKTYSSGMYVRLAFSVAIAIRPDILVVDEALAVGDEGFQRKCYARIKDMQEEGTTILFVSHAAQTVIELCDRAILFDEGEKICEGEPKDIITGYHRMIFAPREKRKSIREELQNNKLALTDNTDGTADFDSGMLSESRLEYEKHGGEIKCIMLTDLNDDPINILQTGKRYKLKYEVHYKQDARTPKFGMLIKTKRGINLGGAVATRLAENKKNIEAGNIVQVAFEFECPFRPGHYFINCGATKEEGGEDIFIHRIIDALQFKVVDATEKTYIEPAGTIDLNIEARLVA